MKRVKQEFDFLLNSESFCQLATTTLTFSTSTQKINKESWTILVSKAAILCTGVYFIQTSSES